ncbi:sulfate adenylyltransferase subunit 1 [Bernardetia litoralis DSM 6794]|uniref:sulfate adenylyltransferase n=1 Tax=Bernardetia litoralis (strain ATCC 23117 / DSM 6794 / NBRC 15988 / NCIMB 1366 / Fx l1 / Sio-4) TaxID=880071 RepID=I4AP78_BERLS|nr:GTP-binding protein [Bernardetia litoralis]AFM05763.1 sulfate adenylyltransferase subunit 1 [Bernardetia litoralis DSM 6794]
MDILRFITAGSVDDGKSTLIGRLLYDSKSIMTDQLEAISKQSKNKENGEIDLAILTDGLRAEREQGITIDVAYKYFSTPKRKFIIADAPGHVQYTRNMVTGASNSDLAIILIDARKGVIEQTRRHSLIASLLKIPHVVVAINKMDLVDFSETVFNQIKQDYQAIQESLGLDNVEFIPISALNGENIVEHSTEVMKWYKGDTLLTFLENVEIAQDENFTHPRLSVQYVLRPQSEEFHDYRGYAGKVGSGIFKKGDTVLIQPSGISTKIKTIEHNLKEVEEVSAGQSVVLHFENEIDISRGDMIVGEENAPNITQNISSLFCWMDTKALQVGGKYLLQHNSRTVRCVVKNIDYKLNINTLEKEEDADTIKLNEIGRLEIKTASPLVFDSYKELRSNGGAILIDETTHLTAAALILQ